MTTALGIRVEADLLDRWREWFAPEVQPFRTDRLDPEAAGIGRAQEPNPHVRDTFHLYGGDWTWLTESEFVALPLRDRRALLYRRVAISRLGELSGAARRLVEVSGTDSRIVWWPSLLRRVGDRPLVSYVEHGLPPSRHREVPAASWARAARVLPAAGDLAGRFPSGSGPNCFANVMAAAGASGTELAGVGRDQFDEWLAETTTPVRGTRRDDRPGVVLVWRDRRGQVDHAAVTIGDGYVLNKGSQGWFSPYVVWTVTETVAASRYPGVTLSRHLVIQR